MQEGGCFFFFFLVYLSEKFQCVVGIQFCSEGVIAYYRAENKAYRNKTKGSFVVEK